ncbi:hypothetical protein AALA90_06995 [Lachnospiraceae bacterium 38-10]
MVDFNGGYVTRGTMKTGDRAMLVKSDGSNYEAVIEKVALYREEDKGNPTPVNEAGKVLWCLSGLQKIPRRNCGSRRHGKGRTKYSTGICCLA